MLGIYHPSFAFSFVSLTEIVKEVSKLNNKEASQTSDIPVKTRKIRI